MAKVQQKQSDEMTLDQLAAEAGDDEGFDMGRGFRKKLKLETTYPVKIVKQTVKVAEQSGYHMVQLTLGVISSDGSVTEGDTVTQCLPYFSDDVKASGDPEKLAALKKNWGNQLHGILRACHPDEFTPFRSEKSNGKWKFFDHNDGHQLTHAEKEARESLMSKATIGAAMAMIHGKYSLEGATCYFVWAPNKKDASNPYANFWSVAPDKYPLAE